MHLEWLLRGCYNPRNLIRGQVFAVALLVLGAQGLLQADLLLQILLCPSLDVVSWLGALHAMMCTASFLVNFDGSLMNCLSDLILFELLCFLCDGLPNLDGSICP